MYLKLKTNLLIFITPIVKLLFYVYKIDIHIFLKEFIMRKLSKSEGYHFTLNLNTFYIILLVHIKDKSF